MLDRLIATELEYIKCFSQYLESEKLIYFWDDELPDMYNHNYIYLKQNMPYKELRDIILREMEKRTKENRGFLRIEANFPINEKSFLDLPIEPMVINYDYMYISPDKYSTLKSSDNAIVKEALTPEILEDALRADIISNSPIVGIDFTKRRFIRKAEVFKSSDNNLSLFVCFNNGSPVGKCELLINKDVSKIEDFDIIKEHQRKGFGTSVLKHLLKHSKEHHVETAYLITDSSETAKEMYNKCGFKKAGEKMELFFSL